MVKGSLICIIVALYIDNVLCLYEDQVGKFDWRQQYIGKASYIEFDQSASSGKRLIVATEQNVLAMLHAKTGEILWRHVFESGAGGRIDAVLQHNSYVCVVVAGGQFVRYFSIVHGDLVWEVSSAPSDVSISSKAVIVTVAGGNDQLAVLSSGEVSLYDMEMGDLKWRKLLPQCDSVVYTTLALRGSSVVAVGVAEKSHVTLVTLTIAGEVTESAPLAAPWVTEAVPCVFAESTLVCGHHSGLLYIAQTDSLQFQDMVVARGVEAVAALRLPARSLSLPQFVVHQSHGRAALLTLHSTTALHLRDIDKCDAIFVTQYEGATVLLALHRIAADTSRLVGYNVLDGGEVAELSVSLVTHHARAVIMAATLYRKKDGLLNLRVVLACEDDALIMLQQSGRAVWAREEALAAVTDVKMLDLPMSNIQVTIEEEFGVHSKQRLGVADVLGMLVKRLWSQCEQLQQFFMRLKSSLRVRQHHLIHDEDEHDEEGDAYLTRDDFNMHKMVVLTTEAGKIFGLDSMTGRVIWSHFVPHLAPFVGYRSPTLPIFVQRTTSHPPHMALITVIGRNKMTGSTVLISLNPISGVAAGVSQDLAFRVMTADLLPLADVHFVHPLVMLDNNHVVHVYPESASYLVQSESSKRFIFTVDSQKAMMQGFALSMMPGGNMAVPLWIINLQQDRQTITNVVAKRPDEHVHSLGVVLGDRSVLYKYLNPNLVVVTAQGHEPHAKGEGADATSSGQPYLNVYLVDAVSGRIVFHTNHKRTSGPVNVVHSENWVTYSYWNVKQRRSEVAVLELYEGSQQTNATTFSSLDAPPRPLVMRHAFIFAGHISTMATAITEKGITSKHILFALTSGSILELPKMFVDARRPVEAMQEPREEGLLPYTPELPRPFEMIINYNQSVYGIRAIHTAPAGLESTSLVLATGLDLFYTRITPSKMFDVLKEDFDHFFIGSVVAAMIAVSIISQKLSAKKALNRAWK